MKPLSCLLLVVGVVSAGPALLRAQDLLPAWNETGPKKAITEFVEKVTKKASPDFVRPEERVAVFDNDGTLWCEQPVYFQLLFVAHRIKTLAPQHPEWKTKEPFASLLNGDLKAVPHLVNMGSSSCWRRRTPA